MLYLYIPATPLLLRDISLIRKLVSLVFRALIELLTGLQMSHDKVVNKNIMFYPVHSYRRSFINTFKIKYIFIT